MEHRNRIRIVAEIERYQDRRRRARARALGTERFRLSGVDLPAHGRPPQPLSNLLGYPAGQTRPRAAGRDHTMRHAELPC